MKTVIPLQEKDFAIEIEDGKHGITTQLLYAGRPAAGMSEFSGTQSRTKAIRIMADFLRQLAAQIDSQEIRQLLCSHNWLDGYCDLCDATRPRDAGTGKPA